MNELNEPVTTSPEIKTETPIQPQKSKLSKRTLTSIVILSILGLVTVGFSCFWLFSTNKKDLRLVSTSDQKQAGTITQISTVGNGWSTLDDPALAVDEAVKKAEAKLGTNKPKFAYVAFSVGYEYEKVIAQLRKKLDPTIKIHGITSGNGIFTNEGLHIGNVGAVGIMLVADKNIDFGVGSVDMTENTNLASARQAGKTAILKAIKDAGRDEKTPPNVILYAGTPRRGDDMAILDGIADVVGKLVPVIGGNSGDESITGRYKQFSHLKGSDWYQFTKDDTYHSGLVLTAIYTNNKVGWAFDSGAKLTDKGGTITRSKDNIIYEIDGKPALDVYNEWLGPNNKLYELLKQNDFKEIIKFTALNPLSKIVKGEKGQVGYYTLHPIPVYSDIATKTLPIGIPVEQGMDVRFSSGTWQSILNRAQAIPTDAQIQGNIARGEGLFGIMTFCEGAAVTLPDTDLPKVAIMTNNVIDNIPYIGIMTEGEHGPITNIRNVNANLVESMLIFGK
jgi:hypothetical protein